MKYVLILTTALAMSGCVMGPAYTNSVVGQIDSSREARQVIPKGLSIDQVQEKLGRPISKRTFNGQTIWSYTHSAIKLGQGGLLSPIGRAHVKSVNITFNSRGRVSRVDYVEQES